MTLFDKAMTVLVSLGLFVLGTAALILAAFLLSGCTHTIPEIPVVQKHEPTTRVILGHEVPGSAIFCVEDPFVNGFLDAPAITTGQSCPFTVDELRHLVSRLKALD